MWVVLSVCLRWVRRIYMLVSTRRCANGHSEWTIARKMAVAGPGSFGNAGLAQYVDALHDVLLVMHASKMEFT